VRWLEEQPTLEGMSAITSLPDWSEFPKLTLDQWKEWFRTAAQLVCARMPAEGVAIFFQTDIKEAGIWIDKGYLVQRAAEAAGCELLWHKVVARAPVGNVTFGRPAYSHLLAFSKKVRVDLGKSTADVLPEAGETTWTRGMGIEACLLACRFVLSATQCRTVVDPFCGHGTVLAVANALGLDAVGVELSRKRAAKARTLKVDLEARTVIRP
jgi:hypothetical protein